MSNSILFRLISGTVSVGFGTLSTMVLGLLGTIIAVRHLSAEIYGTYVLLQVTSFFLMRISSFGLDLALPKFLATAENQSNKRKIFNTAFYFRLCSIIVISFVAYIARPALSDLFDNPEIVEAFLYVPFLYFIFSLSNLMNAALQGFFLFKIIALTHLAQSILNFILIIIFIVVLDQGFTGLVWANLFSSVTVNAFAFVCVPVNKKIEFDFAKIKSMLVFGLPLQINEILTFIFQKIDTLLIGMFLGTAEIAYYEIARKIPESLSGLYEAFRTVYYPIVSKLFGDGEQKKVAEIVNNSIRLISFLGIFSALIALLFGNEIITLLFSVKYLISVPIFSILMIGLTLAITEYTLGYSLVAVGETDKPIIINIIRTSMSLLGNLILIPIFGYIGAAIANVVSNCLTSPLDVYFLRRKNIKARILVYLKPIFVFGICAGFFLLIGTNFLLIKLCVIIIFIILCFVLSVITLHDFSAIYEEIKVISSKFTKAKLPEASN